MNTNNLTRWLVTCALLLLIGVIAGYQFAPSEKRPTQYVPISPPLPTVNAQVNQYLIDHYASSDRNSRQVTYYRRTLCMQVPCEIWGIIVGPEQMEAFLRCYDQTKICVPTFENFLIHPSVDNSGTVTPYSVPTSIGTEHGIGIPSS